MENRLLRGERTMRWKHLTIALAVMLMAVSADVSFGRGGRRWSERGAGRWRKQVSRAIQVGDVQGGGNQGGQTGGQGGNQGGGPSRIQGGNVQPNSGRQRRRTGSIHTAYYRGNANLRATTRPSLVRPGCSIKTRRSADSPSTPSPSATTAAMPVRGTVRSLSAAPVTAWAPVAWSA